MNQKHDDAYKSIGEVAKDLKLVNPKTGKLTDIPYGRIKINKLPKPPKGTKIDNIEITINLNTKN